MEFHVVLDISIGLDDLPQSAQSAAKLFRASGRSALLKRYVEEHGWRSSIPYETLALEFNECFFLRNFVKCLAMCRFVNKINGGYSGRIVDIGCGVGTFAMAARTVWPNCEIKAIDRSYAQTELGRQIEASQSNPKNEWIVGQAQDYLNVIDSMRIMSFFFCEAESIWSSTHQLAKSLAKNHIGERAIVVDYPHVIRSLDSLLVDDEYASTMVKFTTSLDKKLSGMIGQESICTYGGYFVRF